MSERLHQLCPVIIHNFRNWIAENVGKEHKIPLCREMATNLEEQKVDNGSVFKIHNLESGDCYAFKVSISFKGESGNSKPAIKCFFSFYSWIPSKMRTKIKQP